MSNPNDERPAVSCAALFGVCQTCNLWEPEKGYRPDMANMGYCPLFDKRTRFDHGKQCTGHSDLHSPNDVPGVPAAKARSESTHKPTPPIGTND